MQAIEVAPSKAGENRSSDGGFHTRRNRHLSLSATDESVLSICDGA